MIARTLIDKESIETRLDALACEIDAAYQGEEILAVGILKGSVFFLTDLLKRVQTPVKMDFLQVRSYSGTASTGNFQLVRDVSSDMEGRHVLLFEDVVDTGLTLRRLLELLTTRRPKSLRIASLLKKKLPENEDIRVDFLGFTIGPEFVVGYGLDLDESYRNLPYVAIWDPTR